ncbi:uncharacterized protein JCM10292_002647 [Rhodotorula paludigena]|uniref:uncharacterized protein n=1 Tax=Rhodotorula paludigena TaxID=86838 RepID=UPI00316E2042
MVRIILTGATGTAGSEALRVALAHPAVTGVTVLSRRPLPAHVAPSPPDDKLRVVLQEDFASYPPQLIKQLEGHDGALWCLGKSSVGMSEKDYELLTVTYAVEAAKAFSSLKKDGEDKFVFGYLSGEGTDQREGKASQMFGRIKGKAERILAALPSEGYPSLAVFSFRPAGIVPIRSNPEAQWWFGPAMAAVKGLGALYPPFAIKTDALGRGMLEAVIKGRSGSVPGWLGKGLPGNEGVFRNEELKRLAAGQGSKQ